MAGASLEAGTRALDALTGTDHAGGGLSGGAQLEASLEVCEKPSGLTTIRASPDASPTKAGASPCCSPSVGACATEQLGLGSWEEPVETELGLTADLDELAAVDAASLPGRGREHRPAATKMLPKIRFCNRDRRSADQGRQAPRQ